MTQMLMVQLLHFLKVLFTVDSVALKMNLVQAKKDCLGRSKQQEQKRKHISLLFSIKFMFLVLYGF